MPDGQLRIFDTTLRNGEQGPGFSLRPAFTHSSPHPISASANSRAALLGLSFNRSRVRLRPVMSREEPGMLSYVHGPDVTPLLEHTIGECLDRAAARFGDHDALISCHQNIRYSYSGLLHHVNRAARALLRLGVERGDRVGIWGPNSAEWMISHFFFNDTATTEIYTLSLHDALPICLLADVPRELALTRTLQARDGLQDG